MDLLEQAEKRFGKAPLAARLSVQTNQLSVWRSRGKLSAKGRLRIESLIDPPLRAGEIPLEARYFTACMMILARMTSEGDADGLKATYELLRRGGHWSEADRTRVIEGGVDYFPIVRDAVLTPEGLL